MFICQDKFKMEEELAEDISVMANIDTTNV